MASTGNLAGGEKILPGEHLHRFVFEHNEALYIDHQGRRVLADVEGRGMYRVHASPVGSEILVDDQLSLSLEGSFRSSLMVTCGSEGTSRIEVLSGRLDLFQAVFWKIPDYVEEFTGWLPPEAGWSFPQPIFSLEGVDPVLRRGCPSALICRPIERFFLGNEEELERVQWKVQNAAQLEWVDEFPAPVLSHLNACSFRIELPKDHEGIQIVRLFDAFHGRQRARVLVDGVEIGVWYSPWQNREDRIQADSFGIAKDHVEGKSVITLTLDPPAGCPLWNATFYGVDALFPRTL